MNGLDRAKDEFRALMSAQDDPGFLHHRARVKAKIDSAYEMEGFSDCEILEYALFQVIPRGDTKPMARALLNAFGSIAGIFAADLKELMRIQGIGETAARMLKCCMPLCRCGQRSLNAPGSRIRTPNEAAKFLYPLMIGKTYEQVNMLNLDINDCTIGLEVLNKGSSDSAELDIGKVIMCANRNGAKKFVLAHNHPGGTLTPSVQDRDITTRCAIACKIAGYELLDHIIFAKDKYFSFCGNGYSDIIYRNSVSILQSLTAEEKPEIYHKIYKTGILETGEDEERDSADSSVRSDGSEEP